MQDKKINLTQQELINKLDIYNNTKQFISDYVNRNSNKCIEDVTQHVFSLHPELHRFIIIGSTPSFNDGDICEHRDVVHYSSEDLAYEPIDLDEDDIKHHEEYCKANHEDPDGWEPQEIFFREYGDNQLNKGMDYYSDNEDEKTLYMKINSSIYDYIIPLLNIAYETNYILTFKRTPNGVIVEYNNYEDGY